MTTKEFKMCCVVFCKFFEGRKYGEIVQDCYKNDNELIIDVVNLTFDTIGINENNDVRLENKLIMWYKFRTKEIEIFSDSDNDIVKFKLVKEFLEYFKIPLEDYI